MATTQKSHARAAAKAAVRDFWSAGPCGEVYATGDTLFQQFEGEAKKRYKLEPYIRPFARFGDAHGEDVLEIGIGRGVDHVEWAKARPRSLTGIDLTPASIDVVAQRLTLYGLTSQLEVGDAERLRFPDDSFDIVYSYGVLHHTPDTPRAIREAVRVLRPGGSLRIMIYQRRSFVAALAWLRYALLAGRPWRSLRDVLAQHVESPGTQGFTVAEATQLLEDAGAVDVRAWTEVTFGDLLEGAVGQRHGGAALTILKRVWPRRLIRRYGRPFGLALFAVATK